MDDGKEALWAILHWLLSGYAIITAARFLIVVVGWWRAEPVRRIERFRIVWDRAVFSDPAGIFATLILCGCLWWAYSASDEPVGLRFLFAVGLVAGWWWAFLPALLFLVLGRFSQYRGEIGGPRNGPRPPEAKPDEPAKELQPLRPRMPAPPEQPVEPPGSPDGQRDGGHDKFKGL